MAVREMPFVEHVEMSGHIIDSLLLPKVLDAILSRGGNYDIERFDIGQRRSDPSHVRIAIHAATAEVLESILAEIHPHGAVSNDQADCQLGVSDVAGAFPDRFYCSSNFRTQVRINGEWVEVQRQEMDCGIRVDTTQGTAECVPMTNVHVGDSIVVGRAGTRVFPMEAERRSELFEFMSSPVSSERPKGVSVREIAQGMRQTHAQGKRILAVLGPAVVHTGGGRHVTWLLQNGYIDVLFAGNALAAHDMEEAIYGTSLGVDLDDGIPTDEGHEHHLRTINTIRRLGSIHAAIDNGTLKSGIMYECVTRKIPTILCGSIRDDGPLPEVFTDVIQAQAAMRAGIDNVGFCLMVATTLHSIAVGNLLPAWVRVACVDITPATVTKLMDRGSTQTVGIVSDAEPFLGSLVEELRKTTPIA